MSRNVAHHFWNVYNDNWHHDGMVKSQCNVKPPLWTTACLWATMTRGLFLKYGQYHQLPLCWQVRDFSDNWGADRTMFLLPRPEDFPLLFLRFSQGATCHGSSRRKYLTACYSSLLAPGKDLVRDRWACLLEYKDRGFIKRCCLCQYLCLFIDTLYPGDTVWKY